MVTEDQKRKKCIPYQKMMGLSVASELYGTKHKAPVFHVNMGEQCFTNNDVIVIGLMHDVFANCEEEVDLYEYVDYVKGHEVQHIKSTPDKAWNFGINRGADAVIEQLCKDNGIFLRLSKSSDYELAIKKLAEKNIYVNMNMLHHFTHYICNSLEDGRIEYIRSNENEVFKKQMVHIRLKNWMYQPCEKIPYDKLSDFAILTTVLNQILYLSTCQLYQKGFSSLYFGTRIQDILEPCIPYIAKAVTAPTCRECMQYAIKISELLAPIIAECIKSDKDLNRTIEWIRMSIRDIDSFDPKTKEADEEAGTPGSNPFGQSDLYIILPDDEYDELMEKAKEKDDQEDSEGPQMHIRREHPKKEEPQENNEEKPGGSGESDNTDNKEGQTEPDSSENASEKDTSGGKGADWKADDEPAEDSSQESNENELCENAESDNISEDNDSASDDKGTKDRADNTDKEKDEAEKGAENKGVERDEVGSENSENSENPNTAKESASGQKDVDSSQNAQGGSGDSNSSADPDEVLKKIMDEMEKAEEYAKERAQTESEASEAIMQHQEKAQKMDEDVEEEIKPTDTSEIDALYDGNVKLLEIPREYKVDEMIPPELMKEIEVLQKKLESLMKSKKKRFRKQIQEGKLDSSRVAMLAANEINVFKETKKSYGTSACAQIICDNSGSMGWGIGSKRETAAKAMAKIEMAFAKFFPVRLFAYDQESRVIHQIIKGFDEHFSRSAAWNYYLKGRYGGGTLDDYSIRVATKNILERQEKKKLLVVLSDGQQRDKEVLAAVRDARAKGVTVVGIYISNGYCDEERFARMYDEKDYIIADQNNLDFELLRIMKKFFIG